MGIVYNIAGCVLLCHVHLLLKAFLIELFKAILSGHFNMKTLKKVTVYSAAFLLLLSTENWILPKDDVRKIVVEFVMIGTVAVLELDQTEHDQTVA